MWAGACLLLAVAGCGKDDKKITNGGVYSPIITGISSNHEPAARGAANQLTVQVTNVNGLPLTYHWSVEAGTLADSTSGTVTWTPPDSIGTYDVTASIEARDGDAYFFKTMTVHMSVDNEYTRWTHSDQVQFDPAPVPGGGVLYAGYRNVATRSSDAYRVDAPLGPPIQLTTNFFSVTSPTPRADKVDFAFRARKNSSDSAWIYLLPFAGGDTASARVFEATRTTQTQLQSARYAPVGNWLAYVTDSISSSQSGFLWRVHYRDASDLNVWAPYPTVDSTVSTNLFTWLLNPSWGPDADHDGSPDSVMLQAIDFPGSFAESVNGTYFVPVVRPFGATTYNVWLSGAQIQTPDWSPDGQHVVFAMKNAGTNERDLWIINRAASDISEAVRITSGPADDSQPRFSADGNQIFFVSNRVDRYGVTGITGTERRGTNIWSVAQFDRP